MNTHPLTTTAQTVLRVAAGFIFAAHGWQKFNESTIAGTQASFTEMGVPAPEIAAPVIATLELIGGIALILGLLARPLGALLALDMAGAFFIVHLPAGIFVANGGFELVLILGAAALGIALMGAGRLSLDHALFGRRNSKLHLLASNPDNSGRGDRRRMSHAHETH
ncbi:DoxX family protein [Arthrobacter sp. H14]|uniref:DoxX family protein n=1 Tax=Arthrobacter sp. H14 TaxID=1312959 RepID=UPI0004BB8932|nr:DoxX family protein [Arthrobacter sp. H14]